MTNKKLFNYLFAAAVAVGLVLVVLATVLNVTVGSAGGVNASLSLFDDGWKTVGLHFDGVSNTFTAVAVFVTLAGVVALAVDAVLRLFIGKNVPVLRMVAAIVTFLGAILIISSGFMLASDLFDGYAKMMNYESGAALSSIAANPYSPGAGVWLGFFGGIVAAAAGAMALLPQFDLYKD